MTRKHTGHLFGGWLPMLLLSLSLLLPAFTSSAKPMSDEEAKEKYGLHATMRDEWAIAAWEWTRDHAVMAYEWTRDQIQGMLFEDMDVENADQVGTAGPALLGFLVLFSACWGASIAQMRRHDRLPFFLLGAVAPIVAPAVMLFKLDIKGEKELLARFAQEAEEKRAAAAAKARLEEEQAIATGQIVQPRSSSEGVVWNRQYFESIAYKPDGTPAGPWDAVYNGGIKAHVLAIMEVQDTFVQVRYVNMAGKEMVGRIPIARLEGWEDSVQEEA